jgi:hypothetical protein
MPRPGQPHTAEAREKIRKAHNTPAAKERHRAAAAAYWTPERKREASEHTKARMADPLIRALISERTAKAMANPEVKQRQRIAQTAALARPEVRARISAATKAAMARPEVRARMSEGMRKAAADPEHARKVRDGTRTAFLVDHEAKALAVAWEGARPEVRERFLAGIGVFELFAWAASHATGPRQ